MFTDKFEEARAAMAVTLDTDTHPYVLAEADDIKDTGGYFVSEHPTWEDAWEALKARVQHLSKIHNVALDAEWMRITPDDSEATYGDAQVTGEGVEFSLWIAPRNIWHDGQDTKWSEADND